MITILAFLFVLVGISKSGIICPKQSWTLFKNVTEEGSWSFRVLTNYSMSTTLVQIKMCKTMRYRCPNENEVELSTSQGFRYWRQDQGNIEQKLNFTTSEETCKLDCNNVTNRIGFCNLECISDVEVTLTVEVRYRRSSGSGDDKQWAKWEETGQFPYLYKNCNKLYWSSWIETSNCTSSAQTTFSRSCMDCDGDEVQQKYCEGNFNKQTQCQPLWGPWAKAGPCEVILCNSTGERVRRRMCLYGDGSQSPDPKLCSNQSAIVKEQCAWDVKQQATACQPTQSEGGGQPDNTSVSVGIGIAVLLIFVLGFGLTAVRWRRRQQNQINNRIHRDPLGVESADAEPPKQFRSRSKGYNCNQLDIRGSAVLYKYGGEQHSNPPSEYEVVQPSVSTVYDFAEPIEPNAYEFELSTVSQPSESIKKKIRNSSAKLEPNYSILQEHCTVAKENDAYSSLMKKARSKESDYSTLSSR